MRFQKIQVHTYLLRHIIRAELEESGFDFGFEVDGDGNGSGGCEESCDSARWLFFFLPISDGTVYKELCHSLSNIVEFCHQNIGTNLNQNAGRKNVTPVF